MANCAFCGSSNRAIASPCPRCGKLDKADAKLLRDAHKGVSASEEKLASIKAAHGAVATALAALLDAAENKGVDVALVDSVVKANNALGEAIG